MLARLDFSRSEKEVLTERDRMRDKLSASRLLASSERPTTSGPNVSMNSELETTLLEADVISVVPWGSMSAETKLHRSRMFSMEFC